MMGQHPAKRGLRNLLSALLAYWLVMSGAVRRAKKTYRQDGNVLSIFFHNPPRTLFRQCMLWLNKNGFTFVSTKQIIDFLHNGTPLPAGSVWVTFDDGWQANMDNVLPVIEQLDIPITLFIPTGEIEKGGFWFQQVFTHRNKLPQKYQATPFESLLTLPNKERMNLVKDMYPEVSADYIMDRETLIRLSEHPLITIGSHTVNHIVTINCTTEELDAEFRESKEKLEDWTGKPVTSFAYPNGDHDGREAPLLQKYNYQLAATIVEGLIDKDTGPYYVPRNCVLDDGSFAENLCHLMGVWTPFIDDLKGLIGKRPQCSTSSTRP